MTYEKNEKQAMSLQKSSPPEQVKNYFQKVFELKNSGKEFPVNLDEVWPLVYPRKEEAVRSLKREFIKDFDYQALRRNAERGAASPTDYYLSTHCLEFFIARKVRSIFEVYRQVFHKAIEGKLSEARQVETNATYNENQVFITKLGNVSCKGYYTNGVLYYALGTIMRFLGYQQNGGKPYAEKYSGSIKINEGKLTPWYISLHWIDELLKDATLKIPYAKISILYRDLFNIEKEPQPENPFTYKFTDKQMLEIIADINRFKKPALQVIVIEKLMKGGLL